MVVKTSSVELKQLDLAYLGFFLGLRVNELVRQRMERAGFNGVRESHGYLVQHLIEADRSITELARRMGITQQAVSKTVAELTALGMLETARAEDRRSKRIRLSSRGRACVESTRRLRTQLEKRLITTLGKPKYGEAKATLLNCLEVLGGTGRIKSRMVRRPN